MRSGGGRAGVAGDLEAEGAGGGEAVGVQGDGVAAEVGGRASAGPRERRPAVTSRVRVTWRGWMLSPSISMVARAGRVSGEDEGDFARGVGGALEVHGIQGGFDLGHDRVGPGVEGVALAGGRAVQPVELEAEAGVALGEVVEEDRQAGFACGQVEGDLGARFLVAGVGGEVAGLGAVEEEDGAAAGGEAEAGGAGGVGEDAGLGPGGEAGGAEPEAGEVERGGAEGQPVAGEGGRAADLGAAAAVVGGEGGAAGVFVRDEVPVAGEEEGGVHGAGHGRVGEVVALLGDGGDAPVGERRARGEGAEEVGHTAGSGLAAARRAASGGKGWGISGMESVWNAYGKRMAWLLTGG